MEEYIEQVYNKTEDTLTTADVVHDVLRRTFCVIALAFNVLIIFVLIKSKKIHTRTNMLILHFAITDALFVATNPSTLVPILSSSLDEAGKELFECIIDELDDLYQIGSFLFIGMLVSNAMIKTRTSTMVLILSTYFGLFLIFASNIGLCSQSAVRFYAFPIYLISFVILSCVTVMMLGKEVNRFFKRKRNQPCNDKTTFRFNLGRIYVYNCTISEICFLISFQQISPIFTIFQFLSLSAYLSSLYVTIYLTYTDWRFKLHVLNLFKFRRGAVYDVDAAISFADDCSEDEEENGNVNFQANAENVEIGRENGGRA